MPKLRPKHPCSDIVSTLKWFKACMRECGKKFEIGFPFNFDEVPNNQVNKSYFVVITDYTSLERTGCYESIEASVDVVCWFCDANEQNAYEVALSDSETIRCHILSKKPEEGEKFYCFSGVFFNNASFAPYADSNDNIVSLTLNFTVRIDISLEKDSL